MFDDLTWDAILQAWPWFGAAAVVFVVALGLFIVLKPRSKRQAEKAAEGADKIGWKSTGRIDFSDPNAIGRLMLEVEETRSAIGSLGVEHREIRWRSATVGEAKMVLESYNALRNLAMTATFTVSAPTKTKPSGQDERMDAELKDAANGQDMTEVTLVPQDVTH
jgi:hypothetical protein